VDLFIDLMQHKAEFDLKTKIDELLANLKI
jgi:hypothetical protein